MASKAMWEVDPETRSKLAALQKEPKNSICCDCNAPSPQWASPKFGIFICLSCAGVHRGLGVHISFVRSISMDAFKANEIERMRLGGNAGWRTFFEEHEDTKMRGLGWEDATIAERYSGEVGEEWKERLTAKVEGREYVKGETKTVASPPPQPQAPTSGSRSGTPLSGTAKRSDSLSSNGQGGGSGKVKVDDKYFSRLGAENASRSADLPPSQGGKYGGFGNTPGPSAQGGAGAPTFDEVQKDPMAALTKGFGWFTSTVSKTAKNVNDGYIQPTAKQFAEGDFARQAQMTAANLAKQAQSAGKNAQDGFNRFVEGQSEGGGGRGGAGASQMDEGRRSFWDDFSGIADQQQQHQAPKKSGSIGTSAMGSSRAPQPPKKDEWDDW